MSTYHAKLMRLGKRQNRGDSFLKGVALESEMFLSWVTLVLLDDELHRVGAKLIGN